ncbi:MAG: MFS transporter, partial [Candidatus Eremiobacteraeota bacterium]|nr:MFS transporter [Candidatus Eremiobacteraeota bacterium]
RFGERRTLMFGLFTFMLANVLFAVPNGYVIVLGIIVISLSIYNSPVQSLMSKRVERTEQGELQGAMGALRGISMLIGPGIFTLTFAEFAGPWRGLELLGAPFLLAAAMLALALILAWRVTSRADDVALPLPEAVPAFVVDG